MWRLAQCLCTSSHVCDGETAWNRVVGGSKTSHTCSYLTLNPRGSIPLLCREKSVRENCSLWDYSDDPPKISQGDMSICTVRFGTRFAATLDRREFLVYSDFFGSCICRERRLGFMRRKCRRMMAFTSDRLYIVRVEDGRAKASYPIKSVQLAPSDKVNQASGV